MARARGGCGEIVKQRVDDIIIYLFIYLDIN